MGLFKELEGDVAILIENGVYKQVPVYTRDGYIFAKLGGGFVRIMSDGSTTKAKVRLDTIMTEHPLMRDAVGRLCMAGVSGAKALDDRSKTLLLSSPE